MGESRSTGGAAPMTMQFPLLWQQSWGSVFLEPLVPAATTIRLAARYPWQDTDDKCRMTNPAAWQPLPVLVPGGNRGRGTPFGRAHWRIGSWRSPLSGSSRHSAWLRRERIASIFAHASARWLQASRSEQGDGAHP